MPILPYFEFEIFGEVFGQEKGTFQGSPLSPLLCVLFLIDFIDYINNNSEGYEGVEIPVDVQQLIRALLFADDIVLVATSIEQLQIALRLAGEWAVRRKVRYGHKKCEVMRLAREPPDQTRREELEAVELQGHHVLPWVHEFKHLGHRIVEAPEYKERAEKVIPIDEKKLTGLCFAMARAFPSTARCCRVAPLAMRSGVKQVIHAKYLYPTAIMDTDYHMIDVRVKRSLRYMLGMPPDSCSAQLYADLGIWPSEYYAHQRALRMAYRLAIRYWTKGDQTPLKAWDGSIVEGQFFTDRPKFLDAIRVSGGVVARLGEIMKMYKLTWESVYQYRGNDKDWSTFVSERVSKRFEDYCEEAAREYDHPLLATSALAKDNPRIRPALRLGGELAVAALRIRCPTLRLRPDRNYRQHRCRYCKKGRENGRHLLVCQDIPQDLLQARIAVLDEIRQQNGVRGLSGRNEN